MLNIILLLLTTLKINAYAPFDDGDYYDLKLNQRIIVGNLRNFGLSISGEFSYAILNLLHLRQTKCH